MFGCSMDEMMKVYLICMLNMLFGSSLPVLLHGCDVCGCSFLR